METTQTTGHDYFAQATQLVGAAANAAVVTNDEQQTTAVTWLGQVKACLKAIRDMKTEALRPHKEKIATITGEYDATINPLVAEETRIRRISDDYANLKLRQERDAAAQRQRDAEAARLKKIDEENKAAEQKRREAEQAREAGDTRGAAIAERQAEKHESVAEAVVEHAASAPAPKPAAPVRIATGTGTMHANVEWVHELKDIDLVPNKLVNRELRLALVKEEIKDLRKAGKLKDGEEYTELIPGLRIFQQAKTRLR